jgi:hypothetical protein
VDEKFHQNTPEYMFKVLISMLNLYSFWFIIKQQSILSNSSHLEGRSGLSDTICKGGHIRTIPAIFCLNWLSSFIICLVCIIGIYRLQKKSVHCLNMNNFMDEFGQVWVYCFCIFVNKNRWELLSKCEGINYTHNKKLL